MSSRITSMPFPELIQWMLDGPKRSRTVFGVHRPFYAKKESFSWLFGRKLETVVGPAAGPHSQMAQNIVAAYYAGARFFELKTVQKIDGNVLAACVFKPCIKADDEGYNCEWSTELKVSEAQDEYIKAWFLLAVLAKEFGLGDMEGFQFNISVGYDLEGIKSKKLDTFIENMKDAANTECFRACQEYLLSHLDLFTKMSEADVLRISPNICNSVTVSTLHGCPPTEIESIAEYLMKEKKLHTLIKCNPTILDYSLARKTLDDLGYGYMSFPQKHFDEDLQLEDAVPMFGRLMELAEKESLEFGVKLTNTFPLEVTAGELGSKEMYMSGKPLYILSMTVVERLSEAFDGRLRVFYAGGADYHNIDHIVECGIWPVTMATTLLKPGGYQRLKQIAEKQLMVMPGVFRKVNLEAVRAEIASAREDTYYRKTNETGKSGKETGKIPLLDCFVSPCQQECPIHQDVDTYMYLAEEGKYQDALLSIVNRNPLPFITGTLCPAKCMRRCTRRFYESPIQIRNAKLHIAEEACKENLDFLKATGKSRAKVAIIGGGPAGMAAAFFLARAGAQVKIFEKRNRLGGIIRYAIPEFRIDWETIDKDVALLEQLGVKIQTGAEIFDPISFDCPSYDAVILAVGASLPGDLGLEQGEYWGAVDFLDEFAEMYGKLKLGENVVVVGGGSTAIDCARTAKRNDGVKNVKIVYRRDRRNMPADEEEIKIALEEGIEICEMLVPASLADGELICYRTKLGEPDQSGKNKVTITNKIVKISADTLIEAVGERVETGYFKDAFFDVDKRGLPVVNPETMESSKPGFYIIGDSRRGPSIIVDAIADARKAAVAIAGDQVKEITFSLHNEGEANRRKGILLERREGELDRDRCLSCSAVCSNCVDVCPNRANVPIWIPGYKKPQIIHLDYLCNQCGNCESFCPYSGAPYRDKFTLFATLEDMADSSNEGFCVIDISTVEAMVRYQGKTWRWYMEAPEQLPGDLILLVKTIFRDYEYLLKQTNA